MNEARADQKYFQNGSTLDERTKSWTKIQVVMYLQLTDAKWSLKGCK